MIVLHYREDAGTLETLRVRSPTQNCPAQCTSNLYRSPFAGSIHTYMLYDAAAGVQ